jgi:multicomponent Na+:H+ antiporter subunit G
MAVSTVPLLAAVAVSWLGCIGFAGFRSPYDRLHCVTFVAVTAGFFVTLAAFIADGLSDRALKILLFFLLTLANGAAVAHASGRAVARRGPLDGE